MPYDIVQLEELPPRERKRKYNIDELDVGQCIVIPTGEKFAASAIYSAARAVGIKISIRQANKDHPSGAYHAGDTLVIRMEDKEAE